MKYRLFVIANIGFIIGILLGLYFKVSIILFLSIFVGGVLIFFNFKSVVGCFENVQNNRFKKKFYKLVRYCKVYITKSVLLVFISFMIFGYVVLVFRGIKFDNFLQDMKMYATSGKVMGYGVVVSDREDKEYSDVYRIKVLDVNGVSYSNTYCFLSLKKQSGSELEYGDLINFEGEFQDAQDRMNFKGFSYKEYLKTINVYGTFWGSYDKIKVLKEEQLSWMFLAANRVKKSFERAD